MSCPLFHLFYKKNDKANWFDQNITTLCELYVEQMNVENCNQGTMTTRGLNIIKSQYVKITNLRHNRKQLKKRINHLKPVWRFGDKLMKNTELGRKSDGTIDVTPEWWKNELKVLLHYLTSVKFGFFSSL